MSDSSTPKRGGGRAFVDFVLSVGRSRTAVGVAFVVVMVVFLVVSFLLSLALEWVGVTFAVLAVASLWIEKLCNVYVDKLTHDIEDIEWRPGSDSDTELPKIRGERRNWEIAAKAADFYAFAFAVPAAVTALLKVIGVW